MLYHYDFITLEYGSVYKVNKAVKEGKIYKVARGWYSDQPDPDMRVLVCAQYPQAVLTMDSAFHFHGLLDEEPDLVHVATARNSTRIADQRVRQYFFLLDLMNQGVETHQIDGREVRVFSKERMLVELLRNETLLPLETYRKLIRAYRKIVDDLDMGQIKESLALYKRSAGLFDKLQHEVL